MCYETNDGGIKKEWLRCNIVLLIERQGNTHNRSTIGRYRTVLLWECQIVGAIREQLAIRICLFERQMELEERKGI